MFWIKSKIRLKNRLNTNVSNKIQNKNELLLVIKWGYR